HVISINRKHWAAGEFERLIRNPPRPHVADEEIYKVWPTNADRLAFAQIMTDGTGSWKGGKTRLKDAYNFFYDSLAALIEGKEEDEIKEEFTEASPEARMEAIHQALTARLYFIVLELEGGDDPQVIFETLNARGEPLLPSDLIR